jgi:hypothetical protein
MSDALIPAKVFKMLDRGRKKSNTEQIISYLSTEEGAVELSEKQQELLARYRKADDLLRKGYLTKKEVAHSLVKIFSETKSYSIAVAWRDIEEACYIFGSTRKTNKNYAVTAHLDEIDEIIKKAKENSAYFKMLPLLFDCRTRALAQLRDDDERKNIPPAIIFNITTGTNITSDMSDEEAEQLVKDKMAAKGVVIELTEDQYSVENGVQPD